MMHDLTAFSDENLIQACAKGNIAAFEELYNRYWYKLYAEALKRVKKSEIAEEMVQDLFTNIWLNRRKLQIYRSVSGYLYTAIRYLVLSYFQKEGVRRDYQVYYVENFRDYDNSTERTIDFNELQSQIESYIDLLPDKCRQVYELSRKEFKTNKEIAKIMGISEKTVENQLTKALGRLKTVMKICSIVVLLWSILG